MKKILFVLLAICTFHFANAQEFHFMPRIGVNFANLSNSGGDMKPGVNVGLQWNFHCWKSCLLSLESIIQCKAPKPANMFRLMI